MPDKDTTPPDHTDLSEEPKCIFDHSDKLTLVHRMQDDGTSYDYCPGCGWIDVKALFKQYAQPPVVADKELDELLDTYCNDCIKSWNSGGTNLQDIFGEAKAALLQREQRLVAEAEKAARKKIVLHFRKVAQFQKDRGYGCERILGETDIMARNDWQIDERYRDE